MARTVSFQVVHHVTKQNGGPNSRRSRIIIQPPTRCFGSQEQSVSGIVVRPPLCIAVFLQENIWCKSWWIVNLTRKEATLIGRWIKRETAIWRLFRVKGGTSAFQWVGFWIDAPSLLLFFDQGMVCLLEEKRFSFRGDTAKDGGTWTESELGRPLDEWLYVGRKPSPDLIGRYS